MARYERPVMMESSSSEAQEQGQVVSRYNSSEEGYGDCPLLLFSDPNGTNEPIYLQMKDWIKSLTLQQVPLSYHFRQPFMESGNSEFLKLECLRWQRFLHDKLQAEGFSSARFPFKLEKWDTVANQWRMLTVDCHVIVAAYLIFLGKHPGRKFTDYVHTHQMIDFKINPFFKNAGGGVDDVLDYIEVTPILVTPREIPEHDIEEGLRLTITTTTASSGGDLFPKLKFTTPAVMTSPPPEFYCGICLRGIEDAGEKVFRTGCSGDHGHCFHRHCIEGWFSTNHTSCPLCRTTIRHFID